MTELGDRPLLKVHPSCGVEAYPEHLGIAEVVDELARVEGVPYSVLRGSGRALLAASRS